MYQVAQILLGEYSECHRKAHEIKAREMHGEAWHAGQVGLLQELGFNSWT